MKLDTAILYTKDLTKAVEFYTNLGLHLEVQQGNYYASFDFGSGAKLGLKLADKEWEVPGHQTVILAVENVDELYQKLASAGVPVFSELTRHDWGGHCIVLDPDTNKVELVQR